MPDTSGLKNFLIVAEVATTPQDDMMNSRNPPLLAFSVVVLTSLSAAPARAQDSGWETVVRDRSRQVQIDRGSIMESDNGAKVAWARVVMTPAEAATQGYTTIQALNRLRGHSGALAAGAVFFHGFSADQLEKNNKASLS